MAKWDWESLESESLESLQPLVPRCECAAFNADADAEADLLHAPPALWCLGQRVE